MEIPLENPVPEFGTNWQAMAALTRPLNFHLICSPLKTCEPFGGYSFFCDYIFGTKKGALIRADFMPALGSTSL